MTKLQSNASAPNPLVKINVSQFLEGYTRLETALAQIANYNPLESPQLQAVRMRKIAKEALRL